MIYNIKTWLEDARDLSYGKNNLQKDLHYKLWILFNDGRTISTYLDYSKNSANQNCLLIGWQWRLYEIDEETLSKTSLIKKGNLLNP